MKEFNTNRELENKALEETEAADKKQAEDKEAIEHLARLAALFEADVYELAETRPPWMTDMTTEQATNIRSWAQNFLTDDPAYLIRLENYTLLKMRQMEHTEAERQIQKQCYDAMINGYHGHKEEKKTPGHMFDVVENSRYGWVPYGAIYH
eukprot:13514899-Heterocapsa_arctica.AAC.1